MSSYFEPQSEEEARNRLYLDLAMIQSGDYDQVDIEEGIEDIGRELERNWENYGDELYHGTSRENWEDILNEGALLPGEINDASSGEVSKQDRVYFTSLEPVAVHYAEKAQPTREELLEVAIQDIWQDLSSEHWPDDPHNYDLLHDMIPAGQDMNQLSDYEKGRYEGVWRRLLDIPEEKPDPLVIGFPSENVENYSGVPDVEHEFEALEDEGHLAEGKTSYIEINENSTFYVSHSELEPMRENSDVDGEILSIDALKLRHRLKMDKVYQERGIIDMVPVWQGEKRGIEKEKKDRETGLSTEISC